MTDRSDTDRRASGRAEVLAIREAEENDATRICEIALRCIKHVCSRNYTPAQVRDWTARQTPERFAKLVHVGQFVVAEGTLGIGDREGRRSCQVSCPCPDPVHGTETDTGDHVHVLGFGHLDTSDSSVFPEDCSMSVLGLYVDPAAHGSGVGRLLMREMEWRAVSCGCGRLGVVSTLNAVPFYEAVGFRVVADHLHGAGASALEAKIMLKDITR